MFHIVKTCLIHYASATLIDVLHSPFVFELYNSCFAKHSFTKLPPTFSPKGKNYVDKRVDTIITKLQSHFKHHDFYADPTPKIHNQPAIWEITSLSSLNEIEKWVTSAHNDSMIVLRNPHQPLVTNIIWKHLISMPQTTAIIDLYFLGIVFIRKEQHKQIFKLRLF